MVSVEVYLRGSKIIVRATWKIESVAASENYDTLADPTTVVFYGLDGLREFIDRFPTDLAALNTNDDLTPSSLDE